MKNKLKNSFLIATNRKYDTHAKLVIDQLEYYGALDNGEIIVCCPFEIDDSRIKYIKDNKQQNGNVAFNEAAKNSVGEYIYILCDDHYVSHNIVHGDEFLNSHTFKKRKYKISSMASGATCYIGEIPNFPQTAFIPKLIFDNLHHTLRPRAISATPPFYSGLASLGAPTTWNYEKASVMCRFPFFNREMYEKYLNGFVFHPNFNICSHFADNYLSYFLALNGESTIECDYIRLNEIPDTDQFDDGSVEPHGGPGKKYPTGYLESLEVYVNLCKNLEKGGLYAR